MAEQRLATFRGEFESARKKFQSAAEADVEVLRKNLEDSNKRNEHLIENIGLLANRELGAFESSDVGKHWKTRRSGYWGYMHDLQGKVANRIFPRVQELLSEMTSHFAVFVDHFEKHLSALSGTSRELARKLDLGETLPFDLTKTLSGSLDKSLAAANELIATEEQRIISFLDDFVSDEVSDKISAAREKVSDIFGKGTTYSQSSEVRVFYSEVRALLQDALTSHLHERSFAFGGFLVVEADGVPRKALAEVDATLAGAEQDIKAAATAHVGGERETFDRECDRIAVTLQSVTMQCAPLIEANGAPVEETSEPLSSLPPVAQSAVQNTVQGQSGVGGRQWFERIQSDATGTLKRLTLKDGDIGWPFETIFEKGLLSGCSRVALIDPYLAQPHQVRNLKEFVLVIAENAKPKELLVVTSSTWNDGTGANVRIMEEVGKDLFRSYGTSLSIEVDSTFHDRYVIFDHGLLFKLGRGLDIYKPATGLASHRPACRKVRRTDIDVFVVHGFQKTNE